MALPVDPIGTAQAIAAVIQQLHDIYEGIQEANAQLMSIIAQLNTMKSALEQIHRLMQNDAFDDRVQMDLDLALQACQMHIAVLDEKIGQLNLTKKGNSLKLRSKVKVVFESNSMAMTLDRLNHMANALNLLISVLTSRTITEGSNLLKRSNTRKVFKQIEDDAASIQAIRDDQSMMGQRTYSEPVMSKNPWKKFAFDRQILESKPYGAARSRLLRRRDTDKLPVTEVSEVTESVAGATLDDDAITLVDEPTVEEALPLRSELQLKTPFDGKPHFSRMLAFGYAESIPDLVSRARSFWDAKLVKSPSRSRSSTMEVLWLHTVAFEMSIHYQTIDANRRFGDDLLASFKDASSILFAVAMSNYRAGDSGLALDLELFDLVVNDHNLLLAKVILFIDTTDWEDDLPHRAESHLKTDELASGTEDSIESFRARFLQVGRRGASNDRIHVIMGEPNGVNAASIFSTAGSVRQQQADKWGGLTNYPHS